MLLTAESPEKRCPKSVVTELKSYLGQMTNQLRGLGVVRA